MNKNWQQPEVQLGCQIILSELLRLIEKRSPVNQLAGIGLLSQPDMGTLQYCCVESGSPEHQDPELYFFANEWEEIGEVPAFEALGNAFVESHGGPLDNVETQSEFGLFLDECCLSCLDTLKNRRLDRMSDSAIYVYSRHDAADDEYVEWFIQLNGKAYEPALLGLLGNGSSEPYTPQDRSTSSGFLNDDEIEFIAAASCGKLAKVENLIDGMSELVVAEAFVLAARTGRVEVCRCLLDRGVALNHRGYRGKTAFEFAKQESRRRVLELLGDGGMASSTQHTDERPIGLDKELLWILEVKIPNDRSKSQLN